MAGYAAVQVFPARMTARYEFGPGLRVTGRNGCVTACEEQHHCTEYDSKKDAGTNAGNSAVEDNGKHGCTGS